MHLTFLPLDTGSTWPFTRPSYHTPGSTDCTSGRLKMNTEVSVAHSSNVGREMSVAHACNDRDNYCACVWHCTMPYLFFIYALITCTLRKISWITSNFDIICIIAMEIWCCLIYISPYSLLVCIDFKPGRLGPETALLENSTVMLFVFHTNSIFFNHQLQWILE